MGNCVGGGVGTENIFKVTNINDDQNTRLVQKGLMEVTASELIYTDSKSREDWHWPLKFLRKYGCDGDVFTFEAGRKCPGGEGLYAFETRKASILFEKVARNINQGDLSPVRDPNANVTDSTMMNFPPRRSSTISPAPHTTDTEQPSYTNIDEMGNPLQNGNHTPPNTAESTVSNPNKGVQYREVVFDKPPEDHPRPSVAPQKGGTSYTQIDFDRTAQYNEELRSGGGALPSTTTPHDRTSSASTSGNLSPTKRTRTNRHRVHTYSSSSATGRDRHVSRSESSFSSQSSLTESSRDVRSPPKHNGGSRHVSTPDTNNPNSSMYQNVNVGVVSEQQYQNVQVGAGDVSQVFDTSTSKPQPNYSNLVLSATSAPPPDATPTEGGRGSGIAMVNGDSMTTYAQLELSASKRNRHSGGASRQRSMSSSVGSRPRDTTTQPSYTVLDFANSSSTSETTPTNHRSASVSSVPSPSGTSAPGGSHSIPSIAQQQSIPEEDIATVSTPAGANHAPSAAVVDETKVTYGVLNFGQMEALEKLAREREQQIEQEKEEREQKEKEKEQKAERERAASSHKKKKRLE